METIEQEIETLAKQRWPKAGRIDIGSKMSHAWHGDVESPMTGYSIRVSTAQGGLIKRLEAMTLEDLRDKVGVGAVE